MFASGNLTREELLEKLIYGAEIIYKFKTDKGVYYNTFLLDPDLRRMKSVEKKLGENSLIFSFSFADEETPIDTVLNRGEMFRIMSTVTAIIKEFLEDYPAAVVSYHAIDNDSRRYNMYKQYVEKHVGKDYNYTELKILGEQTLFIHSK